ncbi:unnamed protein product [Cercospora beticola]|nr:unnamed protein product [Cercospora beticola]
MPMRPRRRRELREAAGSRQNQCSHEVPAPAFWNTATHSRNRVLATQTRRRITAMCSTTRAKAPTLIEARELPVPEQHMRASCQLRAVHVHREDPQNPSTMLPEPPQVCASSAPLSSRLVCSASPARVITFWRTTVQTAVAQYDSPALNGRPWRCEYL